MLHSSRFQLNYQCNDFNSIPYFKPLNFQVPIVILWWGSIDYQEVNREWSFESLKVRSKYLFQNHNLSFEHCPLPFIAIFATKSSLSWNCEVEFYSFVCWLVWEHLSHISFLIVLWMLLFLTARPLIYHWSQVYL